MHDRPTTEPPRPAPVDLAAPEGGLRRLPERIGPFRIVGVLGIGGMGVVYDAEQEQPRRRVALKIIRDAMLDDADGVQRFAREAEVLGRLQHPGIAQVYATGVAEGTQGPQPYFAMERVSGEPLGRYAERLDRRARLELFARVCDAVHHAHQRGVVHRDLKPSNVLVDESGQPKVLDFGVARLADGDGPPGAARRLTVEGELLGTMQYTSPEQRRGDLAAVDTRTDVYALGAILFELLAGRPMFERPGGGQPGGSRLEAASAMLGGEAPRLGEVDRALRGDLDAIVAKAVARDPAARYPSAAGLAGDVRRHLADAPVTARPATAAYLAGKLARRHRAAVAAGAVALAALGGAAATSAAAAVRARGAERAAVAAQRRAEAAQALAERRQADALAALAGCAGPAAGPGGAPR
jgi:serine/threonine protein kinase